jgi:hypothetical protein
VTQLAGDIFPKSFTQADPTAVADFVRQYLEKNNLAIERTPSPPPLRSPPRAPTAVPAPAQTTSRGAHAEALAARGFDPDLAAAMSQGRFTGGTELERAAHFARRGLSPGLARFAAGVKIRRPR